MELERMPILFGAVVREIRLEKNISQEELAYKSGVHRTFMGVVERGKSSLDLKTAQKVASGLNTPLSTIILRMEALAQSQDGGKD